MYRIRNSLSLRIVVVLMLFSAHCAVGTPVGTRSERIALSNLVSYTVSKQKPKPTHVDEIGVTNAIRHAFSSPACIP